MGGFFGLVSKTDCVNTLFYGTDYHCHLGTRRGGMATVNSNGFTRYIHDITNTQFKSKFELDIDKMSGNIGVGVISDYEDQPLIIGSHLGTYALVTVGAVKNTAELIQKAFSRRSVHFSEMSGNEINQTEVVAMLINQEESIAAGIRNVQDSIEGSCSLLVMTPRGIYAARDRLGRTPVVIGRNENGYAVTMETCALPNLGYQIEKSLGPGEILYMDAEAVEQQKPPGDTLQICSFLWIYYGYPASSYEGINVEAARYRCGAALARRDDVSIDYVAGIPDSGTAHAIGYATKAKIQFRRPFVKYTPTWARSFMPQQQSTRTLVAKMKLIPIRELIEGQRLLFCEDSIVRGTQLKDHVARIFQYGATEIHMRPACPPLIFGCKFLNFSRSRSESELAARRAIIDIEGQDSDNLGDYVDETSDRYIAMVNRIGDKLGLTSLQYQRLDDMVQAIKMPKKDLCTYCWTGCNTPCQK